MNKRKKTMIFAITLFILIVVSITATFSWYDPNATFDYEFQLVADSVFSIYFSSTDVDVTGELVPAVAMEGAIASGKYMDVTRVYNENDETPSWVETAAQSISYNTNFFFRGSEPVIVDYDWFLSLYDDPSYYIDKDQFVVDIAFWLEGVEILPVDGRMTVYPIEGKATTEVNVTVSMYFAYVDELVDPLLKDNVILTTVDITRYYNLEENGNLDITFDTSYRKVEDELVAAVAMEGAVAEGKYMDVKTVYNENDVTPSWILTAATPINYETEFIYNGTNSYIVDYNWSVSIGETILSSDIFLMEIQFTDITNSQTLTPDVNGNITVSQSSSVRINVTMYYALVQEVLEASYPEILGETYVILIELSPAV